MARKRKEEVLHELPPKRRCKVVLQLRPTELKKVSAQMQKLEAFEREAEGGSGGEGSLPTPELMRLFKLLADAKRDACREWIESSLLEDSSFDPSRKALIFAHHHSVHEALAGLFEAKMPREAWVQVTGRTPSGEREELLSRFKSEPGCRFALLALSACGVGLNLACADTAVFAELCWSPSLLEQAESRIHRLGQAASHVNIYYLTAGEGRDSPDSAMFGALVKKSRRASQVVDGASGAEGLADAAVSHTPRREPACSAEAPAAVAAARLNAAEPEGSDNASAWTAEPVTGTRRSRDVGTSEVGPGDSRRQRLDFSPGDSTRSAGSSASGAERAEAAVVGAGLSAAEPLCLSSDSEEEAPTRPCVSGSAQRPRVVIEIDD